MALVKTSIQPTVVNVTKYSPSGNILYFSLMHRQSKSYSLQDANKINGTSGKDARTYGSIISDNKRLCTRHTQTKEAALLGQPL